MMKRDLFHMEILMHFKIQAGFSLDLMDVAYIFYLEIPIGSSLKILYKLYFLM